MNCIEDSVKVFYDQMKWIENATTELHYQLNEVQKKLI